MQTVADRIKIAREQAGLSQEELAKKMGYASKSAVSRTENSGDNIGQKRIKDFANALGVPIPYLMGWTDIEWDHNSQEIIITDEDKETDLYKALVGNYSLIEHIEKLSKLPTNMQETVFKIIDNTYDLYMSSKGGE